LGIEERTVKAHVGRLMRKTGVDNRIELSVRALNDRQIPGRVTPEIPGRVTPERRSGENGSIDRRQGDRRK